MKTDPEKLFFLSFIFLMAGLFLHANPLSSPAAAGYAVPKSVFCPGPGVSPLPDTVRACGDSVVLDAGTGYRSYLWNTGDTTQQITVTQFGLYTVTLKTASGSTIKYSSYVSMVKAKILNKDTTVCGQTNLTLSLDSKIKNAYDTVLVDSFVMTTFGPFDRTVKTVIGGKYFYRVSGTWSYWSKPDCFDAFYSLTVSPPTYLGSSFGCNYIMPPSPQIYNPSHNYVTTTVIGTVTPLKFAFRDKEDISSYADNSGSLNYSVYKVSPRLVVHILWSTGDTTASIPVSPSVTTTYTAIITDGITSCRDSVTIYVTTPATPSISIRSSTADTCVGSNIVFSAQTLNGGASPCYQWKVNGQNAGKDSSVFTTSSLVNKDIVSCQLTTKETCITSSTATSNNIPVAIHSWLTPAVTISTPTSGICQGDSLIFTASPVNEGTTPVYQWLVNGIDVGNNNTVLKSNSLKDKDVISCCLTNNAICTTSPTAVSNSILVTVQPWVTPSVTINTTATTICQGSSNSFIALPVNGGNSPVYQWKINGKNIGQDSYVFTSSSLVDKDVISCQLINHSGCVTTDAVLSNNIAVNVQPWTTPSVTITASAMGVCNGSSVTFTASPVNEGDSPVYQWLINGQTVGGKSGGDYNSATYTSSSLANNDVVSCIAGMPHPMLCATAQNAVSNSIPITVYPVPTVSVGGDREIIKGDHLQLNGSVSGENLSLKWTPGLYLSNDTIADPEATPLETTSYQLKVTSDKGCVATAEMTIKVLGLTIPNVFSPNGDGINDVWRLTGIDQFSSIELSIFNRYGQPVYQSNNYNNSWDGKFNGQPLPVATYYYVIKLGGLFQPLSGSVTILR